LGLGQTELSRLTQAEHNLNKAYKLALEEKSPSAAAICQGILEAKRRHLDVSMRERNDLKP
jgi:STIP1 family protein 1